MANPRGSLAAALGALGLGTALASGAALANGRPPTTTNIHFRPGAGHENDIAVGATFGLLVSHDGGTTFRHVCEEALHFTGNYDPDYEYAASGTIFATTFDGLLAMRDGCTFAPTQFGTQFASAVAVGPDGAVYAGLSVPPNPPNDPGDSKIYKSLDDGVTFAVSANPGQPGDWWESIEVAPSSASRVYAAGYRLNGANPRTLLLFGSSDGGVSYQPIAMPGNVFQTSSQSSVSILAVSPTDPEVFFVKVTLESGSISDGVYLSENAGASFTRVLGVEDSIRGLVVRANGDIVAASTLSGVFTSTDGGHTFTRIPDGSGQLGTYFCLTGRGDGTLWACAQNQNPDLMAVGTATTPTAWTKVMRFPDIAGPVDCPAGTIQHDTCEVDRWCTTSMQLGAPSLDFCAAVADDLPPPDAGTGPGDPGGSCCGASGSSTGLVLSAFVGALVLRRRRRPATL